MPQEDLAPFQDAGSSRASQRNLELWVMHWVEQGPDSLVIGSTWAHLELRPSQRRVIRRRRRSSLRRRRTSDTQPWTSTSDSLRALAERNPSLTSNSTVGGRATAPCGCSADRLSTDSQLLLPGPCMTKRVLVTWSAEPESAYSDQHPSNHC